MVRGLIPVYYEETDHRAGKSSISISMYKRGLFRLTRYQAEATWEPTVPNEHWNSVTMTTIGFKYEEDAFSEAHDWVIEQVLGEHDRSE